MIVLLLFGIQLAYSPIAAQAFLRVADRDRDEAAGPPARRRQRAGVLLHEHALMVTIVKTAEVMTGLALLALPLCLSLARPPKGGELDLAAAAG